VSAIDRASLNQPGMSTHEPRSSHSPWSVPVTRTPPNRLSSMGSGSTPRRTNAHCGTGRTLLRQAGRVRSGVGAGLGPHGNRPADNAAAVGARLAPPAVGSSPGPSRRARWGGAGSGRSRREMAYLQGARSRDHRVRAGQSCCEFQGGVSRRRWHAMFAPMPYPAAGAGSGAGSGTCASVEAS